MFLMLFLWTSIVEPLTGPISKFCDSASLCLENDVQKSERKVTKLHLFFGFIKNSLKLDDNVWCLCIIFLSGAKVFLQGDLSKHLMDSWTSYCGQITTVFAYLRALVTVWDKHTARSPEKIEFCVTALSTRAIRSMIKQLLLVPVVDISSTEESTSSFSIYLLLAVLFILPFGFARDNDTGPSLYVRILLRSTVGDVATTVSLWNSFLL